jgi:activator of HSP90 ATPase
MAKNIVQKLLFKNTKPKALYDLYLNAKKHSGVTGAPAKISAKAGTPFSAHDGYITGENIELLKDSLIVQTWRGSDWEPSDPDSIFIIQLEPKGKDVQLHMIHAGVPDRHAEHLAKGWHEHYWEPWKKELAAKPKSRRSSK